MADGRASGRTEKHAKTSTPRQKQLLRSSWPTLALSETSGIPGCPCSSHRDGLSKNDLPKGKTVLTDFFQK